MEARTRMDEKRAWEVAMSTAWPSWRVAFTILGRPPRPVIEWLRDFRIALQIGVEAFMSHIACGGLGIETNETCDCDLSTESTGEIDEVNAALVWLHDHHGQYNRAQLHLIRATIGLTAFRELLERDLAVTDSTHGPNWGHLLRKDYTQQVLAIAT